MPCVGEEALILTWRERRSALSWLSSQNVGTSVLNSVVSGVATFPAGYRTAALNVPWIVLPLAAIDATWRPRRSRIRHASSIGSRIDSPATLIPREPVVLVVRRHELSHR